MAQAAARRWARIRSATSQPEIGKKKLDEPCSPKGEPEAAGLVHGAIEEFAQELAYVIRRFLRPKAWRDTERIVVGGGFRQSRVGELAIARTDIILKAEDFDVDLVPIRYHPDEAGLIGALHLAPSWMFEGHDSILAVDIGGTNIRCGVVRAQPGRRRPIFPRPTCWKSELWRHADEEPTREDAVKRLVKMLKDLIAAPRPSRPEARALHRHRLSRRDRRGRLDRERARRTCRAIGRAAGSTCRLAWRKRSRRSAITTPPCVMHNDGVVQGLSEVPFMQDVERWGVLTIGTGLGNARFTNRGKKAKGWSGASYRRE